MNDRLTPPPGTTFDPPLDVVEKYYTDVGSALARRVAAAEEVLGFTSNTDVIGALAEGAVNQLIRDMVAPARVSSGTVLSPKQQNRKTLQVDTIIWTPMPLPALYEFGSVAIVPYESVLAAIEVKRSDYSSGMTKLAELTDQASDLMRGKTTFMGVVCVVEDSPSDRLLEMVQKKQCVWLLTRTDKGIVPNPHGVLTLSQFLVHTRQYMFGSGKDQGLNPFAMDALRP